MNVISYEMHRRRKKASTFSCFLEGNFSKTIKTPNQKMKEKCKLQKVKDIESTYEFVVVVVRLTCCWFFEFKRTFNERKNVLTQEFRSNTIAVYFIRSQFVRSFVRSRFLLKINKRSDKATAVLEERAHTKLA